MTADQAAFQLLLASFAGWVNREQGQVIDYLREENRILKEQLRGRRLGVVAIGVCGIMRRDPGGAMHNTISKNATLCSILILGQVLTGQSWVRLSPTLLPPARGHHMMVYDSTRDRVVLFGGWAGQDTSGKLLPLGDTWEFDGTRWLQIRTSSSPSPRWEAGGAYDPNRKVFVIYGGSEGTKHYSDTWEFDGKNWKALSPATNPGKRDHHVMFYDPTINRVVLFGGVKTTSASSTADNETWAWDGTTWSRLNPSKSPPKRWAPAVTFDTTNRRAVLFGGYDGKQNFGDTWHWTGSAWQQVSTTISPAARNSPGLVRQGSSVALFGGHNSSVRSDFWSFDGKQWIQRTTAGTPPGRRAMGLVYDSKRGRILLFGGSIVTRTPLGDFWSMSTGLFESYGKGCASTTVLPTISGTPPKLGQTFTLEIKGFLPKPQFGQVIFGVSNTRWGLITLPFSLAVLGMSNCDLLVSLDTSSLIATDAQGSFKTTLKVPSSPSLLGAEVFGQAWVPDPKANPLGVAMTNGFRAVVGF